MIRLHIICNCRLYQISSRNIFIKNVAGYFGFTIQKSQSLSKNAKIATVLWTKIPWRELDHIINHLALAWLVIPWPLHCTFFCLLIIFLTRLTSLVCYAIFFFQIICFVAWLTIKICIYSVFWQNIFTKKTSKFVMISQDIKRTILILFTGLCLVFWSPCGTFWNFLVPFWSWYGHSS